MKTQSAAQLRCIAGALVVAMAGCTDSFLYEPIPHDVPVLDRAVTVKGQFCTDPANSVLRPVKIILAMDTTLSMAVTDPNGDRATAMVNLLNNLPQGDPEIYISVLLFAGFTPVWLTNGGLPGFTQLITMTPNDIAILEGKVLAYGYPGNTANRGGTDFVKPLDEIYAEISQDISQNAAATALNDAGSFEPIRAQYSIIFLSDGGPPSAPQDGDIDARVLSIRSLAFESANCRLNTVRIFEPAEPADVICNPDSDSGCEAILETNVARMQRMADEGGGEFRDFENNEPINFLTFNFGTSKRHYQLERMTLFNLNAVADSAVDQPDSDGDGLIDSMEVDGGTGTDPRMVDSIGDGFSDGVKYFIQSHSTEANSITLIVYPDGGGNEGCPSALIHVDSDGDGLWDCDELLLGTSSEGVDTDGDGVPDLIEWLGGTQPAAADMENDPDSDGLLNAAELRMHTNPNMADVDQLVHNAYRYTIETALPTANGGTTETTDITNPLSSTTVEPATDLDDGSTCYNFEIDNVLLVPTLDIGAGPGLNNLMLAVSVVPADDPTSQPITHIAHLSARYPINGIKGPPDGILPVTPANFARYLQ